MIGENRYEEYQISGDTYSPKKDGTKIKLKSPKIKKPRKSKSPTRKLMDDDGTVRARKKPGPKPGSKNKPRASKLSMHPLMDDEEMLKGVDVEAMANPMVMEKVDNVSMHDPNISGSGLVSSEVGEGSLAGLGPGELADIDDEQFTQMMMEDEEYGKRQLELAAIEIAKRKKEEREAKKMEKARLKALEILAAERERENAPEGMDGEVPKKKKRGRRSKAEILAEQMRRDGTTDINALSAMPLPLPAQMAPGISSNMTSPNMTSPNMTSPNMMTPNLASPNMSVMPGMMTPDVVEAHMAMMPGDGQLFSPEGSPMKPKRRGRGKGKKTLALEAARAAEAVAKNTIDTGMMGMGTDSNPSSKYDEMPNILPTPGSSTSGSAPSTPPAPNIQGSPSTQASNSSQV